MDARYVDSNEIEELFVKAGYTVEWTDDFTLILRRGSEEIRLNAIYYDPDDYDDYTEE